MSVKVTIEQGPGGSFKREMLISRVSNTGIDGLHVDIRDMVSTYEVIGMNGEREVGRSLFRHRFGDDVFVLVGAAGVALGWGDGGTRR